MLPLPAWNRLLIGFYCAVYIVTLVGHIIYTLKVLSPSRNPEKFVQIEGYKPRGLFFLRRSRASGMIEPSLKKFAAQLGSL
jgi:hypothetical protein